MVTQNIPNGVGTAIPTDRGMAQPDVVAEAPMLIARSGLYWGPVIAGSLLAIAILALSGALGYACGVPVFSGGGYGWGAFFWSIVTAIIAFFCGGYMAGYEIPMTEARHGVTHGLMVWGLSIPLIMVLFAGIGGLSAHGLIGADVARMQVHNAPNPAYVASQTQAAWGAFASLIFAVVLAAIGGSLGANRSGPLAQTRRI